MPARNFNKFGCIPKVYLCNDTYIVWKQTTGPILNKNVFWVYLFWFERCKQKQHNTLLESSNYLPLCLVHFRLESIKTVKKFFFFCQTLNYRSPFLFYCTKYQRQRLQKSFLFCQKLNYRSSFLFYCTKYQGQILDWVCLYRVSHK